MFVLVVEELMPGAVVGGMLGMELVGMCLVVVVVVVIIG
jgi:hypothetical protein